MSGDADFIAASRAFVPAALSALDAVLAQHQPKTDERGSLIDWVFCSCGAMEVHLDDDGYNSIGPAKYPCATRRAITERIDIKEGS